MSAVAAVLHAPGAMEYVLTVLAAITVRVR